MNLLHEIHQQGATIVIVTHDPKIAAHTQRTIELRDGQIDKVTHNGHNGKSDQQMIDERWKRPK
jgi:macrolide transport system ATP-binding/permease protein